MLKIRKLANETAVAIQSGAMEADTISKYGRSSKSQMSKENLIKSIIVFCFLLCTSAGVWGQNVEETIDLLVNELQFPKKITLTGTEITGEEPSPITITFDFINKKIHLPKYVLGGILQITRIVFEEDGSWKINAKNVESNAPFSEKGELIFASSSKGDGYIIGLVKYEAGVDVPLMIENIKGDNINILMKKAVNLARSKYGTGK